MPTKYISTEVEVDIDIDDFEDKNLIEEMEYRGYTVTKNREIYSAIEYWERGDRKEALILLEREYPELFGLSKLLN